MLNRMTLAMSSIVVLIVAASSFAAQPTRAQSTAQGKAQSKADECLARPGATAPKGSHWYYRLERPSGRRCWYLGPVNQKMARTAPAEQAARTAPAEQAARTAPAEQVVRTTPAEQRATPMPPSRSSQPDEQVPAEPAAATDARSVDTGAAAASTVTAIQFSAAWPAVAGAAGSTDRDATTAGSADAENAAAPQAQEEDTMPVRPTLASADHAAAAPAPEPAPGLGHLLIFLAATLAFVAIAVRAIIKLWAAWFGRSKRNSIVRPAAPVIRPRGSAAEPSIEEMTEPAVARLREIAKRWDAPTRIPRQPRIATYDVVSDYEVKAPPPWRRRVA